MHELTAAHRTLASGLDRAGDQPQDRPFDRRADHRPRTFVEGRIVDLSLAAAKQADVWQAGVAQVRLEVLRMPVPFDRGGRWAVQIGSFRNEGGADALADRLSRRYKTAKVLRFSSPVGDWWVRVRVLQDDRKRAEEIARDTQTVRGQSFSGQAGLRSVVGRQSSVFNLVSVVTRWLLGRSWLAFFSFPSFQRASVPQNLVIPTEAKRSGGTCFSEKAASSEKPSAQSCPETSTPSH